MSRRPRRDGRSWSERLYAIVVCLYPQRHRQEYGAAMRQVFRELLRDVETPRWRVWLAVLADLPGSLLPEHLANLTGGDAMGLRRLLHHPVVRRGAPFGLSMGLVWTIYNVINNAVVLDVPGNAALNNGLTAALLLLFAAAGFVGSRQAGSISAGTWSGVVAALISSAIGIGTLWIATFVFFEQGRHNPFLIEDFRRSGMQSMDAFLIDDALGATFFGSLLALGLGTLLGTLGGLVATVTGQPRT